MAKKINSRAKGAAGERELSHALTDLLGVKTRRGQQFSGLEGDDVVGLPGLHIECKRVESLNIHNAVDQSVRDAKVGEVPTVFHRKNRTPWLVTVRLEDLAKFAGILSSLLNPTGESNVGESDRADNGTGNGADSGGARRDAATGLGDAGVTGKAE